ncbi:probable E3 ubiquitin-protein ligase HERC3 isoform X2 [Sitodiplosis mosellana]|uniref:probable E3 ubiquitin-protein ligase HERC3 isoform X2 n=1 Tax=Sitodiplosis mosellana TaxID=263140 RepID=UPI002445200B|nr:probable E3 ubiquitin-protein ligase HERC3 isoform X2 [Sitodiplosis mosellana]
MTTLNIYFAGFNGFGQLKNLPKVVTSLEELKLDSLTATKKTLIKCLWNYCAYANGSDVYICGFLNGETFQERRFPFEYPIQDVACTDRFCLVLLSIGTVYKIDCQTFKVTEINSTIIQRSSHSNEMSTSKIFGKFSAQLENDLNESKDEFITHITAGRSLSVVITNKNNVYNMPLKIYTFPAHVKIKKVCCGNEHCLILTTNGDLRGQLGLGGLESEDEPVLIEALAGIKVIDVATGGWHSVAVSAFNDLYVWGWNVNGQLGLPLFQTFEAMQPNGERRVERQKCSTVFASPVIVDLPKESSESIDNDSISENQYHPVAVSAGTRHTIVKIDDGSLMASGWNKYGQLANDKLDADCDQFHIINTNVSKADEVICGDWSTFVISKD